MTVLGSIEAVIAAVQEDARSEIEKIERDLSAMLARLREEEAALPVVIPDAEERISRVSQRCRNDLAAEDWADHEAALSDREIWIQSVVQEGRRKLLTLADEDRRADLVTLVQEAIERLPNGSIVLLVPAGDVDFVSAMVRDGAIASTAKEIVRVASTTAIASGCLAQTADGRIQCENTYEKRVKRFEGRWRSRLSELFASHAGAALAQERATSESAAIADTAIERPNHPVSIGQE